MKSASGVSVRIVFIVLLAFALLAPLLLVNGVAEERQSYYRDVVADIGQSWGRDQRLLGPFLVIPVLDAVTHMDDKGRPQQRLRKTSHIVLPETLQVATQLTHEFRQRGIYSVPVYTASVTLRGELGLVPREAINTAHRQVFWDEASLVVGVSDTRAVRRAKGSFAGASMPLQPGSPVPWLSAGIHVPLDIQNTGADSSFEFTLDLAGTTSIDVAPIGNRTQMRLTSSWPHPSFAGSFLPQQHAISADGATANWSVSALARGIPRHYVHSDKPQALSQLSAAMVLHQPVTSYTIVDRGIKYGALFIGLTFLTALCFELISKVRFHLIQYAVVGLALVLFYLTLLSLSEQLAFAAAYALATGVIVGLLAGYAWSITRSKPIALAFGLVEALLYWVLYVLLQLENLALLTGTGLLLTGLAALMVATRNLHQEERVGWTSS